MAKKKKMTLKYWDSLSEGSKRRAVKRGSISKVSECGKYDAVSERIAV